MVAQRTQSRIIGIVISFLVVLIVVVLLCVFMGAISGEEFSPDTFARRSFRFYEIPLLHIQVFPIKRKDHASELADWLRANKMLKPAQDPRWHLVVFNRNGNEIAKGDAKILTTYLDSRGPEKKSVWLKWSKANLKRASALWPRVSIVANQGLYIFIPDMMEAARLSKTAAELKTRIDKTLVNQYREYSLRALERGEMEVAVLSLSEAIKIDGNNRELLEARATIFEKIQSMVEAQADRQKAESLKNKN